jgi:uncharacterized protein involved in high-affinity Fe2+ transport
MKKNRHTFEELDAFYRKMAGCVEGEQLTKAEGIYGLELEDAIVELRKRGYREEAAWVKLVTTTEEYVRFNGKELTMGAYQVFNAFDGTHIKCNTESEAKALLVEIAKKILEHNKPSVCRALQNENGDSVWIAYEIENPYTLIPTASE